MNTYKIQQVPRPVESFVMQRPMTRRDWAMAMVTFAAMGLTGCGIVDAIDDATGAQVSKITGPAETCTTHYTVDMGTGVTDSTQICEVAK